ncbi:MAG: endonuclease/exonuclease/phosphatase family protein [Minisyncoccota bacterium]
MLYRNRELDRAFRFIAESDFDIFCLQEVPGEFLKRLQALPFHTVYRVDAEKVFPQGAVPMYNVIISKHAITGQGEIPFDDYWSEVSLRTRLFTYAMRLLHFAPIRNRGGLYADITSNGRAIRVFCLHLMLAHPSWRIKEFERAMLKRDKKPTIVCGDFNILEKLHITPLNWLMGGRFLDSFLHQRERTHIEKRFVAHELNNALRGEITHPLSRSQLDHILVSHVFSIKNAQILSDRVGSDHHPIRVEID